MEKATKLENEEIKDAKSIKHKIPKDLLGMGSVLKMILFVLMMSQLI